MVNKIIQPQEIEVWYLLPSIRRSLAASLKKKGFEQKKIASILGVTDAAISQYSNNKRAMDVDFNKAIKLDVDNATDRIIRDNSKVLYEIQRLLRTPEMLKTACQIHKKFGHASNKCNACLQR